MIVPLAAGPHARAKGGVGTAVDIPMDIDRASGEAIRTQIVRQLRAAIESGLLGPGCAVPSSRRLATTLGVSRSTVVSALLELEGEGWIESAQGAGTYVSYRPDAPRSGGLDPRTDTPADARIEIDMRPGDVNPADVSMAGWRAAWRTVEPSSAPPPSAGCSALRQALSSYLGSSRGLPCEPRQIVVCAGTAEALTLLALAFDWRGGTVAVEDPGYPQVRDAFTALGVRWAPLDVTDPGRLLGNLRSIDAGIAAVYLTPSHQYPLGHRIDPGMRRDIIEWSRTTGVILLEDDYDSEFRFGVAPLPSLAGLDPDASTVYLGTISKVLDPGLRLSYLRVPPHLLDRVLQVRDMLGATVAAPVQQAVAHLIGSGELARHIARVRRLYQDRRRVLLQELAMVPAITHIAGTEAGLHVVAQLRTDISSAAVVDQARGHSVLVTDLDDYRAQPDAQSPGLVLGYGQLKPATIRQAVGRLAALPALRC